MPTKLVGGCRIWRKSKKGAQKELLVTTLSGSIDIKRLSELETPEISYEVEEVALVCISDTYHEVGPAILVLNREDALENQMASAPNISPEEKRALWPEHP